MPREPMDERFRDRMRRERSDLILRHTATLGAELGWDGFRVEDVAQRVGVAKGTIYLDFPDKENLVGAALSRCGAELLELLRQSVEPVRGAGAQMSAALRFLAALVVDHPELSAYLRSAMSSRSSPSLGEVPRYVRKLVEADASRRRPGARGGGRPRGVVRPGLLPHRHQTGSRPARHRAVGPAEVAGVRVARLSRPL